MSTVQATSATAVQDLAKSLIKSFDANSDGQLGQDEFGSFLSQLMSGIQTASGTLAASPACYWVGEAMQKTDFKDLPRVPKRIRDSAAMTTPSP